MSFTVNLDLRSWLDFAKENMWLVYVGGGLLYFVITILFSRWAYRNSLYPMEDAVMWAVVWPILGPFFLISIAFEWLVTVGNRD